jgi:porin
MGRIQKDGTRDMKRSRGIAIACVALAWLVSVAWAPSSVADEAVSDEASVRASGSANGSPPSGYLTAGYWEEVWSRDRLTGDWGGLRTDLEEHGVKPRVRFSQFLQGVTSGGLDQNGRYGGKVDWILDVDVSKLAGIWPGMFLNLHAETQYGRSVIADAGPSLVPNTGMVLPLPDCDCTEITNLTLAQGLWEGAIPLQEDKGAVVLAAGKLNIVDLLTLSFPNFANGLEGFLNFNALYPAWPYFRFWFPSQYGASLSLFNEERGMPQMSFLVYGQDNVSDSWDISDSFSDGVGLMGLFRVFWDWGDKQGYAAVLASGSTKEYSFIEDIVWEPIFPGLPIFLPRPDVEKDNPWQVSPFLYQEIWRGGDGDEHERKAYVWLTGALADKAPSFARWNVLATVEALGPIAGRPIDRMGLAGWYTAWNDSFKDELRLVGISPRNVFGFELYYNFAINPWLRLTANLQLGRNLDKDDDLAVIPGGRLVMEF